MIEVQFSKKLWRMLSVKEREEAEKIATEMIPHYEGKFFFSHPPTEAEKKDREFGNQNVEITFVNLSNRPKHFLLMLMPLYDRKQRKKILYLRHKDEDAFIHLDFQYSIKEGHHRLGG